MGLFTKKESSENTIETDPPPYRESIDDTDSSSSSDDEDLEPTPSATPYAPMSGGLSLPIVVPQITKVWKGAFHSPFVRAYTPVLEAHNISQSDFLTFLDGLNEAFVAHPVYEGLGIVAGVMQMCYGVQAVQMAGIGLQVGATVASGVQSYTRTRMYVNTTQKNLFHPAGLHISVLTTKKMLKKIGYPEEKFNLPDSDFSQQSVADYPGLKPKEAARVAVAESGQEDVRVKRIQALEGHVEQLDFNVPDQVKPDNFFKKMGAAQADRLAKKQNNKDSKRRVKVQKKQFKAERRSEKTEKRLARRTAKRDAALAEYSAELKSKGADAASVEAAVHARRAELDGKIERYMAKRERKMGKKSVKIEKKRSKLDSGDTKKANKIRWIVLTRWEGDEDSGDDSLPESDPEVEQQIPSAS